MHFSESLKKTEISGQFTGMENLMQTDCWLCITLKNELGQKQIRNFR